jgi:uncharacterized protein YjeT (DUF2065 family)
MNKLSVISIILGIFAIVFRAPLIFAPDAVMKYFSEKVASTNNGIRGFGLFLLVLGLAMILTARGSSLIIGKIIVIWGMVITFVSIVFMLIFPEAYMKILNYFSTVDSSVLRGIGILGVAIGAFFLYFGLVVLWD